LLSHRELISPREGLRALAGKRWRRRQALVLKLAGFSYREIMELLGVTYTNVRRHLSGGARSSGGRLHASTQAGSICRCSSSRASGSSSPTPCSICYRLRRCMEDKDA